MVNGKLLCHGGELEIRGVSIDSRTIEDGNLFVPIVRMKDGHEYVEEAINKGAAASFWQTDHPNPPQNIPIIIVDDCLKAFQSLASAYRNQLAVKIVGVTGSNGKTTTKDMINGILSTRYNVHKTKGNLNSQIGVPLTILDIAPDTDIAVIEMGMSERGQIGRLSQLVKPDISVITMVGLSHLSTLGSREQIAAAKLEIIDGMPSDGTLIYHGDEPLLIHAVKKMENKIRTIRFGESSSNDYQVHTIMTNASGITFEDQNSIRYWLPLLGKHNAFNAIAAIAAANILGIKQEEIMEGFKELALTGMRMEVIKSISGFTIINDAWNASPVSMKAAIETFQELNDYSQRIVVLGDMLELGNKEVEFHHEIGRFMNANKVDFVFTLGNLGKEIANEAKKHFPEGRVFAFEFKEDVIKQIKQIRTSSDAVLIKGSRGMELEKVVCGLL